MEYLGPNGRRTLHELELGPLEGEGLSRLRHDNLHHLVYCTASGRSIYPAHLRRSFNRMVTQAGARPITPHGMRKTHINLLVAVGGNIRAVAARVGHRDVTTTLQTYTQLVPQMERELLALETRMIPVDGRTA